MKKLGKEDIIIVRSIDGIEKSRQKKNLTVYQNGDSQVVHFVIGYRDIKRENDGAYLYINYKTLAPRIPSFITNHVKKTG